MVESPNGMRLRDRLLLFSTAQLLVFGTVFALAYGTFERTVLPMFEDMLGGKSERVSRMIRSDLDTALLFPGGLPAFLETEKGKVLPTYLTSVSKRLSEENAKVLEELPAARSEDAHDLRN
jgi:hypothetical protein